MYVFSLPTDIYPDIHILTPYTYPHRYIYSHTLHISYPEGLDGCLLGKYGYLFLQNYACFREHQSNTVYKNIYIYMYIYIYLYIFMFVEKYYVFYQKIPILCVDKALFNVTEEVACNTPCNSRSTRLKLYVYVFVCVCIYILYIYIYKYVFVYIYIYKYMYIYIHIYIYVYIYIYIYIYI